MTVPGISGDMLSSEHLARVVDEPPLGPWTADRGWVAGLGGWWRRAEGTLGPASAPRLVFDVATRPLLELLGYTVARIEPHAWGHAGVLARGGVPVAALLSTPWGTSPARAWRLALRSSVALGLPWALTMNGQTLAIVDATQPWSRRLLAFDLAIVLQHPRAVSALARLAHADALAGGDASLAAHVSASDRAGVMVCAALGEGVLHALGEFVAAFDRSRRRRGSRRDEHAWVFEQSLTMVYRLLFLFFAEARDLLPVWHRVYREAYSIGMLCRQVMTRPETRGVWPAVQAMARLAHAGWRAGDLTVTAFNGRLFAPRRTPLGEARRVPDGAAARAVVALGTRAGHSGLRPIAFHDLGVEQLGAVYERVLEYEPVRSGPHLRLRPTSTARKTSGSFYTPRAITDFLVRRTLGPLVEGRTADEILALRVVDPAMGSGAFLVAACRFLTERLEHARVSEGSQPGGEMPDDTRGELARTVAERCLFGIDLNPTAVQLARLSLWLTTLAAGRPLTFLDHHLATGNSLVGARLSDLAWPPQARRLTSEVGQLELFDAHATEALAREVVPQRWRLALDPSTSTSEVREKERRLDRLSAEGTVGHRWTQAADLWCGLALDPSRGPNGATYHELQRYVAGLNTSLPAHHLKPEAATALDRARSHGAFHWELAFPEVFVDEHGRPRADAGFDAVLGNPPWEMMRADTGDARRRDRSRQALRAALAFVRGSGHYPMLSRGQINQYQLFLSRALALVRHGGRFGLIMPSGLQTDVGSADLRRALFDTCRIDTWIGFENRKAIFPIHRSVRFLLMGGETGSRTDVLPTRSGLTDAAALAALPDDPRAEDGWRPILLSRPFLSRWDPAHLTIPTLATPLDARIAWRALQAPPLSSPAGWAVRFGRELNATDDENHFVSCRNHDEAIALGLLPVVDGRHLRPFGLDLSTVERGIRPDAARRLDPSSGFGRSRVCYRDVASPTNRLTLIAAQLPAGVASTHTVFSARRPLSPLDTWCLIGLLNSLVANYLVRLQMTTHVTAALMARLPVPRPADPAEASALAELAEALARRADPEEDMGAYAQLNARAARSYGLSADEHAHVVSTFPLLSDAFRRRTVQAYG